LRKKLFVFYKDRNLRTDAKGSCFYSSLIQCTDTNNHNNANIMKLRLSLCGHVEKNWKYFVHFILPCDQEAVTKYVKKQKLNNTWGGEIELVAFVQKSRKRLEVNSTDFFGVHIKLTSKNYFEIEDAGKLLYRLWGK
jgi:hypothetical protein